MPASPPRISVKLSRVWILAIGSRGEIQPCLAVGAALVERGLQVTFFTSGARYAAFAQGLGMTAVVMDDDAEETVFQQPQVKKTMARGKMNGFMKEMAKRAKAKTAEDYQPLLLHLQMHGPPDLVLSMHLTKYFAWFLAIHYKVPFLMLNVSVPSFFNPNRGMLGLPLLPFGLDYYVHKFVTSTVYSMDKHVDRVLEGGVLQAYSKKQYQAEWYISRTLPELVLLPSQVAQVWYSKNVFAEKCLIGGMHRCVGPAVLSSQQQISMPIIDQFGGQVALGSLISFLIGKPKPIYLGWGSMVYYSPEVMVEWIARAVKHAGERAIVVGGFAGLSHELLEHSRAGKRNPDLVDYARHNVLFVTQAPHEWLFDKDRVSAVVHHGGAGTTLAALRHGLPSVVTPVFADQFDYAFAINKLEVGIGFEQQMQRISWKTLGNAIRSVTSNAVMAERAATLGESLRNGTGGSEKAADEVERYWRDYCESGRFAHRFPDGRIPPASTSITALAIQKKQRHTLLLGLGVAGTAAFLSYVALSIRRKAAK